MGAHRTRQHEFHPRGLSLARRQGRGQAALLETNLPQELRTDERSRCDRRADRRQADRTAPDHRGCGILDRRIDFRKPARDARRILMDIPDDTMKGIRSALEPYAKLLASQMRTRFATDWGLSETGAT